MVQVKVCGITNLDDALAAAEAGADMLGLVFFARSPRYIEPERAGEIVAVLRQRGHALRFVGVFVNESLERVHKIATTAQLDVAQLHGDEPPEMIRALCTLLPQSLQVIKALRPRDPAEAGTWVARYRAAVDGCTPAFIVDAFDAQRFGGTGARADWGLAASIAREFPILLAGGLDPDNVVEAIHAVHPWGVDVSSGVERAPGIKDHDRVRQFIRQAKTAQRRKTKDERRRTGDKRQRTKG